MPPATAKPNQPQYYGPSETALLFLDYQNVLFSMITDESVKKSVLDSAKTLLASARQNKVPIIHCLINTKLDPPPTSKIYEQWSTIHKPLLEANLDLAKEHPDLAPNGSATGHESTSLRVPGPRSALLNKDLITTLRKELGVTSLILGGIATSGAIIGTALQGIDEDFVVTVVRDAVWDPNSQVASHLLDVVLPVSGYVVSTSVAVSYMQPEC
ncbi:unnamed protein product [Clonostachys rosea f. rosea IK726]|jgi:nicotinamidase-related amidase|uniref:Isochorismatase-like domain-containing protein n=2 Tax=Bionectria ochroleuca TaxID=29856 RepID=A0A8H7MZM1_BIOOC|nr:unnamed protein product [Clonostachys rosea f. rosea IK726]